MRDRFAWLKAEVHSARNPCSSTRETADGCTALGVQLSVWSTLGLVATHHATVGRGPGPATMRSATRALMG